MKKKLKRSVIKILMKRRKKIIMKKEPMKSFEIIKEMYEHFVKKSRKQEPKLMICEKEDFDNVETALKEYEKKLEQAQEDKKMLDIFKNALTVERDIPPELEIKESEKGSSYIFKEAVKIHENRIEEILKKSLREWVLKNAFPKELKALEIIKECFDLNGFDELVPNRKWFESKEKQDLLKEVLTQ